MKDDLETRINREFWESIKQINGISVQTGLEMVSGHPDVYERTLKLTIREIEKCDKNLNDFLASGEMYNFSVEVHSMRGSLANIGLMELSLRARELEFAADQGDINYCAVNMPLFLEKLRVLKSALTEAFNKKNSYFGPVELPPEVPPIFKKLLLAFESMDFLWVLELISALDKLDLSGAQALALKEEIEEIKEFVIIMDYGSAAEIIRKLLKSDSI